jgi:tRNA(Ile)-lysidine synthase
VTPGVAGDAVLEPDVLRAAPEVLRLRVLAGTLGWVAGAVWRPRLASRAALDAAIAGDGPGRGVTRPGCVVRARQGRVAVRREPARVARPVAAGAGAWDGRWDLAAPPASGEGLCIGALGREGLAECPEWRRTGLAREVLLTTPALWRDGRLEAAPFARDGSAGPFRRISALAPPWVPRMCVDSAGPNLMLDG